MPQHFLLSRTAKTLSLAQVFRMSDAEAEAMFRKVRWPETEGAPVCPHCGGLNAYECRRPNGALRFRCKACAKDFTITSGTLFAFHKLPLRGYLAAIAIFCNEVKGKSMLAISRDLGVSYKAAFVLAHKMREAMAEEMKGRVVGGEGKVAEVDGGYFGGYVKPANLKENRVDRRLGSKPDRQAQGRRHRARAQRQFAPGRVPVRERRSELDQVPHRQGNDCECRRSVVMEWAACAFEMKRINHQEAYSFDGACTNWRGIFQPHAPRRSRPPSPYRRNVFAPLRPGSVMARRQPPHVEWRSSSHGRWASRWRASRQSISADIGSVGRRRESYSFCPIAMPNAPGRPTPAVIALILPLVARSIALATELAIFGSIPGAAGFRPPSS